MKKIEKHKKGKIIKKCKINVGKKSPPKGGPFFDPIFAAFGGEKNFDSFFAAKGGEKKIDPFFPFFYVPPPPDPPNISVFYSFRSKILTPPRWGAKP